MSDTMLNETPVPGDTSQVVLRARGIGKSFFGVRVLEGIDIDIRHGEVHVRMTGSEAVSLRSRSFAMSCTPSISSMSRSQMTTS